MITEELSEILMACSTAADARERLDHDRLVLSRMINQRLNSIAAILGRLPDGEVIVVGDWAYWSNDEGPQQTRVRRVYDLAGLLAEMNDEAASDSDGRCEFDYCQNPQEMGSPFCRKHWLDHQRMVADASDDEPVADAIERADQAYPDADEDLKAAAEEWCLKCHRPIEAPGRIHPNACHCGVCWKAGCRERVKPGYSYCAAHAFVVPTGGQS